MTDRLTAAEAALLQRDEVPHAWHVTEVTLLAGEGLTRFEVSDRVAERLAYTPRFRHRVLESVVGDAWVDEQAFDVTKHVRQLRIPARSTLETLTERVGELQREPLTRYGPRWDIAVAATLKGKRSAIITRVNPAWVDGVDHVHLLQELVDDAPVTDPPVPAAWTPQPPPAEAATLVDAVRDPGSLLTSVTSRLGGLGAKGLSFVRGESVEAPIVRHVAGTGVPLATVQRVAHARGVRVHDVILAMVAGGLRRTGERRDSVAMVPQAVEQTQAVGALGFDVGARTVALPVRAEDALVRLDQLATLTQALVDTGRLVPAARMTDLPGMAPATLHCLAARCAGDAPHEVLVSNVPGPQTPRYLGERQIKAVYPMLGLTGSQRYSVGVTSYAGQVYLGLCGVDPVDELAVAVVDELQELLVRTEA